MGDLAKKNIASVLSGLKILPAGSEYQGEGVWVKKGTCVWLIISGWV